MFRHVDNASYILLISLTLIEILEYFNEISIHRTVKKCNKLLILSIQNGRVHRMLQGITHSILTIQNTIYGYATGIQESIMNILAFMNEQKKILQ